MRRGTPPEDADLPEFDVLEVDANYTCADFDRELRRDDDAPHAIYVTKEPLFSPAECAELIAAAEAHVEGAWGTIGAGRHAIFGGWVKDVPPARAWLDARLRAKIYPALCRLYPRLVAGSSSAALRVQSAYLFKYDAASRAATDVHVDSALLSFTIALNAPDEYDGGGTWYEDRDETVEMPQGGVAFRASGLRHRGLGVTRGSRYVIGGFVMAEGKVEHVRRSTERAVKLLSGGGGPTSAADAAEAARLLEHATAANPRYAVAQQNLGAAYRALGDERARAPRSRARALNPRRGRGVRARRRAAAAAPAVGAPAPPTRTRRPPRSRRRCASRRAARAAAAAQARRRRRRRRRRRQRRRRAGEPDTADDDADAGGRARRAARGAATRDRGARAARARARAKPDHAVALVNMGNVVGEAGAPESEEVGYYERAVAADPTCRGAHCSLLRARAREAVRRGARVLSRDPRANRPRRRRSDADGAQGRRARAPVW